MADIFGRASDAFGGAFAADAAKVTFAQDPGILGSGEGLNGFSNNGGVGLLTQNLSFQYTQQVTRIYELGTNYSFYVAGRTQGSLSVGRILGPRPVALAFYQKYANVCDAATNHLDIELSAGCKVIGEFQGQTYAFSLKFCVITSIGVSMTAQDMIINEQLQVMFGSLGMRGVNVPGPIGQNGIDGAANTASPFGIDGAANAGAGVFSGSGGTGVFTP